MSEPPPDPVQQLKMSSRNMKISVCMTAYNHEKFIGRAIEGVLAQQVSRPVELVISNDNSSDATGRICAEYASKHPEKIRYISRPYNLGMMQNFVATLAECDGEYVAICEGDDYWVDDRKLQIQTEVLDARPELSMCCHDHFILKNGRTLPSSHHVNTDFQVLSTNDYLLDPFFHTSSYFFRNSAQPVPYPDWFRDVLAGDHFLVLFLSLSGKIGYINRPMSVFRHHGSSLSFTKDPLAIKNNFTRHLELFNEHTSGEFSDEISEVIRKWDLIYTVYEDTGYMSKLSFFLDNFRFYRANYTKVGGFRLLAKYLITPQYFDLIKRRTGQGTKA
jgi:glycosyltransferase involved in cell wall biosynthesis